MKKRELREQIQRLTAENKILRALVRPEQVAEWAQRINDLTPEEIRAKLLARKMTQ